MRTDWSLSKDGKVFLNGGKIIRVLEKNGVIYKLQLQIKIQKSDERYKKIEDGVVNSHYCFL